MRLHGGLAERENLKASDVDQAELARGSSVEMEHTRDPAVARRIALDHLAERPDYYTMLERCESGSLERKASLSLLAGIAIGWGISQFFSGRSKV